MSDWMEKAEELLSLLGITLSKEQREGLFLNARITILAGGEGSGKSFLGGLFAFIRAYCLMLDRKFQDNVLVWIVGADYEDARMEFDYIISFLDKLGALDRAASTISSHQDQPCVARTHANILGNIIFKTVSGYDPLKIAREEPDIIIGCEISRWPHAVFLRCYNRLLRKFNMGGCGFFSGSFETSIGWFAEVFNQGQSGNELDIRSLSMPTWGNLAVYPGGYDHPALQRARALLPPAKFMERFGGVPAPPEDSVFPEFRVTLHVNDELAELRPDYPVYLAADPGDLVYAVEFVQFIDGEVHLVDEVYVTRYTHEQVLQEVQLKPAWKWISRSGHVMDVAGKRMSPEGFGSAHDAWYRDVHINFDGEKRSVDDTVEKLRSVLAINPATWRPRLIAHSRCKGFIAEMGGGPSPVPDGGRWRMKNNGTPDNANDHAAKAVSYLLQSHFGTSQPGHNDGDYRDVGSYLQPVGPNRRQSSVSYLDWN